MLDIYNLIGGIGAAIVIVAYFATQRGRLSADDWRFPLANLLGALLIVISLFADWNLPSFTGFESCRRFWRSWTSGRSLAILSDPPILTSSDGYRYS